MLSLLEFAAPGEVTTTPGWATKRTGAIAVPELRARKPW